MKVLAFIICYYVVSRLTFFFLRSFLHFLVFVNIRRIAELCSKLTEDEYGYFKNPINVDSLLKIKDASDSFRESFTNACILVPSGIVIMADYTIKNIKTIVRLKTLIKMCKIAIDTKNSVDESINYIVDKIKNERMLNEDLDSYIKNRLDRDIIEFLKYNVDVSADEFDESAVSNKLINYMVSEIKKQLNHE